MHLLNIECPNTLCVASYLLETAVGQEYLIAPLDYISITVLILAETSAVMRVMHLVAKLVGHALGTEKGRKKIQI